MTDSSNKFPTLSPREKQCLTYLALGLRPRDLAQKIGISEKTVEKQIVSARKKLRASTREQAVAIAITSKLL